MWILLGVALLLNTLVGRFISKPRGDKYGGQIRDVGFDYLPDLRKYDMLHDMTLIVPFLFLLFNWRTIDQTKYISYLTIMYFLRALTNIVTQYPRAKDTTCKPMTNCNDYMFSGHTTFNIVTSYFVNKGLFPAYPIFSSLIAISTREHYSIDVLMAWIIFFALKCTVS